jgi:hypothetical protein
MKTFQKFLAENNACYEAKEWAANQPVQQIWDTCPRGNWSLWLVEHLVQGDELKLESVRAAVDCARLVLSAASDIRVTDCIALVDKWCRAEAVTQADLHAASAAAWAANAAAWVASAAASDDRAARAANAAAWVAGVAANNVITEGAARSTCHQECADIARRHIPWERIAFMLTRAGVDISGKAS